VRCTTTTLKCRRLHLNRTSPLTRSTTAFHGSASWAGLSFILSTILLVTAGTACTAGAGQECVIIMSVAQAVHCYVVYFHANNCKYNNELLPQISQYFVVYFPLITVLKIHVECSSRQHSNTHAIRSLRVLTFEISFCTQRLITFQNVFDNVDIQLLCMQEILEILCPVFHGQVCKEWCTGALSS